MPKARFTNVYLNSNLFFRWLASVKNKVTQEQIQMTDVSAKFERYV